MTARKTLSALLTAMLLSSPLAVHASMPVDAGDQESRRAERAERNSEREEDRYDEANEALDDHDWRTAARRFSDVAKMRGERADRALYWLAYSQGKMGQRGEALNTLLELQKSYPKSRWNEEGKKLEVEIRQSAGQTIEAEKVGDEELKLMALSGIMHSDPERGVTIIEKMLASPSTSPKVKEKALFLLAQSSPTRGMDLLARIAKGQTNPDLQAKAVKYLGLMAGGNDRSQAILADVYNSSTDTAVRRQVIKAWMLSADRQNLLRVAKTETNRELRSEAVRQLGLIGARAELAELYTSESAVDIRKSIIQAMFLGGNADKLAEIARTEKVTELRLAAIKNLGLLGGSRSGQVLVELYDTDGSAEVRKAVIHGLFLQQNGKALVSLARKEKDPQMKKEIVSKLALTQTKEATDYLMEYLEQ